MREIQQQLHALRQHLEVAQAAGKYVGKLLEVVSCPKCGGTGDLPNARTDTCAYCHGTGRLDISDWPPGAVAGALFHAVSRMGH